MASTFKWYETMRIVRHAAFLTKPYSPLELRDAIFRCLKGGDIHTNSLVLQRGTALLRIPFVDIAYAESKKRDVIIHSCTGDKLVPNKKLSLIEELLPVGFVRCHQSYLVNSDYVVEVCRRELILCTGVAVPISQGRRDRSHQQLKHLFGGLL